ncbi:nucleotidyltransferase-like protein [Planococcus shenhongbingii]|uniref:Nucleotidyltransferase-like protein n=1 Tax=Planococcus shenhongbingii TaxID=3058398 RepID=A0ABT8NHU0_9BACL|nr:nucleotidyltransferase-like protein [Planococcus sp. N017]MDN7247471.1 nucleotidyltransferase-like protein [Planococcus sp. N017]
MEQILRPIYQERASHESTLGVVLVEKREKMSPITDTFDSILLIITKENETPVFTKHYTYLNKKAAMHIVTERQLHKWLLLGTNRKIVDWLFHGRIIYDRNEFMEKLKMELKDYPFYGRKIKMGMEFSKLIRRYLEGKVFFEEKNYLDAYHHIVESLHHLARLAVLENGLPPEVTVWTQVKQMEPAIYKLYEELVLSDEALEKRLELLFLASEFFIHSRTKDGAQHIREVMEQKERWTIQELHEEEELRNYSSNLEVFIEFLVEKDLISVEGMKTKTQGIFHRYYYVKN